MSDDINKSVESSQPIQENIDTNENTEKSTASIESKKGVGDLNTDKPQGLSKKKVTIQLRRKVNKKHIKSS